MSKSVQLIFENIVTQQEISILEDSHICIKAWTPSYNLDSRVVS
jgi:hypothetical protein